jgi:hypothetical protein
LFHMEHLYGTSHSWGWPPNRLTRQQPLEHHTGSHRFYTKQATPPSYPYGIQSCDLVASTLLSFSHVCSRTNKYCAGRALFYPQVLARVLQDRCLDGAGQGVVRAVAILQRAVAESVQLGARLPLSADDATASPEKIHGKFLEFLNQLVIKGE